MVSDQEPPEHASANPFGFITRALTEYKDLVTVSRNTPARDAIRLLKRHRLSQLPIVHQGQVDGLFSYRSFALAVADIFDLPGQLRTDGLSVWECVETPGYLQSHDDCQRLFDELEQRDAVLTGARNACGGIITAMGVLRYLYHAASPFLLIAEIELMLRLLIARTVDRDELELFARTSLTNYKPENVPVTLVEMTFNDYLLLIVHGKNWGRFDRVFQASRDLTGAKLRQIRDLRNDVFHSRRPLGDRDRDVLTATRDWMLRLAAHAADLGRWA